MPQPLVAIVGRPNVGKSTLFNRILGFREAIVHNTPGVTRDRKYGDAEWAGRQFTVIDTGGFVPHSVEIFETAIREQAGMAIEEADSIIFVVDAVEGVTPLDREIAEVLRKSDKPIHLIVNKIDSSKQEFLAADFYELGLGDPIGLAALGGRQIGDFLDVLTSDFKKNGGRQKKQLRLRLAVIGKPNVGKSSFVNALLGRQRHVVTEIPGTTRDPVDSIFFYKDEEIILIDTAGLRKKSHVQENVEFYSTLRTLKSVERSDVAVIVVDAHQGVDKQDLQIIESTLERHRPALIAVNKWDLVEKETNTARDYELAIQHKLGIYDFLPVVFISALTKQRVQKVIDVAKEVHAEQSRRITTSVLNKKIIPEIERYPPKSSSPKEIKIKYASQLKTSPPMFCFFCNEPKLVQEAYRRFLDNKLRDLFGFRGVPFTIVFKKK